MRVALADPWRLQERQQRADDRRLTYRLDHFHGIGSLGGIRDGEALDGSRDGGPIAEQGGRAQRVDGTPHRARSQRAAQEFESLAVWRAESIPKANVL